VPSSTPSEDSESARRVVRSHRRFVVYHGNDWQKFVADADILGPFDLRAKSVVWEFDEHECCMVSDRETVRQILRVRERWPAT
jgi:hypothetical protein